MNEEEAERVVGEALTPVRLCGYFSGAQLTEDRVPDTAIGRRYLHSYSPLGAWYVTGISPPYTVGSATGTDHGSPYGYDTDVHLAFYGLAFQTGTYKRHAESVDPAVTRASLLGINASTHATGRLLTEALAAGHPATSGPSVFRIPASALSANGVNPGTRSSGGDSG